MLAPLVAPTEVLSTAMEALDLALTANFAEERIEPAIESKLDARSVVSEGITEQLGASTDTAPLRDVEEQASAFLPTTRPRVSVPQTAAHSRALYREISFATRESDQNLYLYSVCLQFDERDASRAPLRAVLRRLGARVGLPPLTPVEVARAAQTLATETEAEDGFYIIDVGMVERTMDFWRASFPRIDPHYAVKCFSDLGLMKALAALGAGFDCASNVEVELARKAGVDVSTRVIYANPGKKPSEIRALQRSGCDLTTYDSVEELEKIAAIFPGCRVVVRIAACDPEARCQLGNKYGAPAEEWERLIDAALEHGLPLVGVAFHVGSGSRAPAAFAQAIADAKVVFDLADARGLNLEILDIGGGFSPDYDPSTGRLSLGGVPAAINAALDEHFPAHAPDAPRVIAEPGRYFAMHSATFCTQITGVRQRKDRPERHLFIADGLYGSFNCSVYDGVRLGETAVLAAPAVDARRLDGAAWVRSEVPSQEDEAATAIAMVKTDVFGPTCDGMDQVLKGAHLPRDVKLGDWLVWPSFGAYTLAGAKDFNGLNVEGFPSLYVYSAAHALVEKNALSHVGGGSFSTCELGGDARR